MVQATSELVLPQRDHLVASDIRKRTILECINVVAQLRDSYADPAYCGGALNAFSERFACKQAMEALTQMIEETGE